MTRRPFSCLSAALLLALSTGCASDDSISTATPQATKSAPPNAAPSKPAEPTEPPTPSSIAKATAEAKNRPTPEVSSSTPAPPVTETPTPRPSVSRAQRQRTPSATPTRQPANGSAKAYARSVLSDTQYACLDRLYNRESGWNHLATNPSSGAYGIPQALPAEKMATAGADWRTNPVTQVRWGLSYIEHRYGTPCGAWTFWQSHHWY